MKRMLFLITLTLVLALALGQAQAEPVRQELLDHAKSSLTEVFGYTAQEAKTFVFEDKGKGELRFWPKEHPEWVYTLSYDTKTLAITDGTNPFYVYLYDSVRFPGEAAIRDVLRAAREQGWFTTWDEAAREGLWQAIKKGGNIYPSLNLALGLKAGDITASQALAEFFISCLGEAHQRLQPALAWEQVVMQEAGLAPEAPYQIPAKQTVTINLSTGFDTSFTRFEEEPPEALKTAFAHPRLEAWTCLSGTLVERHNLEGAGFINTGLAAFEKEGQRLLLVLENNNQQGWTLTPVGGQPLRTDRPLTIKPHRTAFEFCIEYQDQGQTERFIVSLLRAGDVDELLCQLNSYHRFSADGQHVFEARGVHNGWELHESKSPLEKSWFIMDGAVFAYLDAITDIQAFPTSLQAWEAAPQNLLPEGYALAIGVHLRESTSSRSKDLGLFNSGSLVKVQDKVPGDPFPWIQVEAGLKKGYMSSVYITLPQGNSTAATVSVSPLPVARAKKDIQLKTGTGLLNPKVTDLQKGQRMHVLCQEGSWLYVVVPRGDLGWLMDVEGIYGYVKAGDVDIRATGIQLDWMD